MPEAVITKLQKDDRLFRELKRGPLNDYDLSAALPQLPGKSKGRAYRKCDCAIWVQGTLGDLWQHKTLKTSNWQYASTLKANWEARNAWETEETGLTTIEAAVSNFLAYCESSSRKTFLP